MRCLPWIGLLRPTKRNCHSGIGRQGSTGSQQSHADQVGATRMPLEKGHKWPPINPQSANCVGVVGNPAGAIRGKVLDRCGEATLDRSMVWSVGAGRCRRRSRVFE
jgi:hypothetical protein